MENLEVVAAQYGAIFINDTEPLLETVVLIEVKEAITLTDNLRISGLPDSDQRSQVIKGDVDAVIPTGTILRPPKGRYFTTIVLGQGSYNAVLGPGL